MYVRRSNMKNLIAFILGFSLVAATMLTFAAVECTVDVISGSTAVTESCDGWTNSSLFSPIYNKEGGTAVTYQYQMGGNCAWQPVYYAITRYTRENGQWINKGVLFSLSPSSGWMWRKLDHMPTTPSSLPNECPAQPQLCPPKAPGGYFPWVPGNKISGYEATGDPQTTQPDCIVPPCTPCETPNENMGGTCQAKTCRPGQFLQDCTCVWLPCDDSCKIRNEETGECQDKPEPECQAGHYWKKPPCVCAPKLDCPDGYEFDEETEKCIIDPQWCPRGSYFDLDKGECVKIPKEPKEEQDCEKGQKLVNGKCEDVNPEPNDDEPCPAGMIRLKNGKCVYPDYSNGEDPAEAKNKALQSGNGGGIPNGTGNGTVGGDGDQHAGKTGYIDPRALTEGHGEGTGTGTEKQWGYETRTIDFTPWDTINGKLEEEGVPGLKSVMSIIEAITADPVTPVFDLPMPMGKVIHCDLTKFDPLAQMVRIMLSGLIYIGLVFVVLRQWRIG